MTSEAAGHVLREGQSEEIGVSKKDGLLQDVEIGSDAVDIDRIEKVYA